MKYHGWEWEAYDYRFITELHECKDIIDEINQPRRSQHDQMFLNSNSRSRVDGVHFCSARPSKLQSTKPSK